MEQESTKELLEFKKKNENKLEEMKKIVRIEVDNRIRLEEEIKKMERQLQQYYLNHK